MKKCPNCKVTFRASETDCHYCGKQLESFSPSGAVPCSVSSTRREVIENKLLVALEDEGAVAILANEEMLDDLIRACWNYEGDIKRRARIESIRADLTQLRDAAFPRNASVMARPDEGLNT